MKLSAEGCRARQQRLAETLVEKGLGGAIIARRQHVYYFTGFLHNPMHAAACFIDAKGRTTLAGSDVGDEVTAADEIVPYENARFATMHSSQYEEVAAKLQGTIPSSASVGADLGGGAACITGLAESVDLTRELYRLRKRKHADEVEAIRGAIAVCDAMYAAAKEVIEPGADEVEVFAHIRAEATKAAGEDLEWMGNDFRANDMGGLPRQRQMQSGELYILDAGPLLHGYFADNCRTFAVDGAPSEAQVRAWETIDALFAELESAARPGMPAVDLFRVADGYLGQGEFEGLVHHLGHGIGLAPHETPELNPQYDAVLEVGDVFTMEPGLYSDELKAGIRLEENYLLSADGLVQLTSFPRGLR